MRRACSRCHHRLSTEDLAQKESKKMEAERKAAGLEGMRFLFCHCTECEADTIFVDIIPIDGEHTGEYEAWRAGMEAVVRRLHGERVGAVIVPVGQE